MGFRRDLDTLVHLLLVDASNRGGTSRVSADMESKNCSRSARGDDGVWVRRCGAARGRATAPPYHSPAHRCEFKPELDGDPLV